MKRFLFFLWNFYPPFIGSGIWIDSISKDLLKVRVRLKKRRWTSNIVGTQFGGSIYAMTDPFYMAMWMQHLGREYVIWDKAAQIRFRKPGRESLVVDFQLTTEEIEKVKQSLEVQTKLDWEKEIIVKNLSGETVAEIKKIIFMSRKSTTYKKLPTTDK